MTSVIPKNYSEFQLTDLQRPYFGLSEISSLEEVQLKNNASIFYMGNTIKKIIKYKYYELSYYEYIEIDTEINTNSRLTIIPKTNRGKEKKITPSNILNIKPDGTIFNTRIYHTGKFRSFVSVYNSRNNIRLPISNDDSLKSISNLHDWIHNYINTCPKDYFSKIEKLKTEKHKTIKYKVGDIFRVEIDREFYGFGLIIGILEDLKRLKIFSESHPLNRIMTVPILVRLYKFETHKPNTITEEITLNSLLPTQIKSDNDLIWGTHEIIDNKILFVDDIHFPMQLDINRMENYCQIGWGPALFKVTNKKIVENVIEFKKKYSSLNNTDYAYTFSNCGVGIQISGLEIRDYIQGKGDYLFRNYLDHNSNNKQRIELFNILGIDQDMTFDEFNLKYNGLTRQGYIDLLNNK